MSFTGVMEHVAQGFEAFGAAVLVIGLLWSLILAVTVWRRSRHGADAYRVLRSSSGVSCCWGWRYSSPRT